MTIHLQIDRLILQDMNLSPQQRRQLQVAVEAELSRLLTERGLPASMQNGGEFSALPALSVTPSATPTQMGQHIAQEVYRYMMGSSR